MTDSTPEQRAAELGLAIPDYADPPYGRRYGNVKAFHRSGRLVLLGGITAESRDGERLHPGVLGADLTVEQGYAAARQAAVNCLGMVRYAIGSLDEVTAIPRVQVFVAAVPEFEEHHLVAAGMSDLFLEVFGPEIGTTARATMGVTGLSRRNSVELWPTFESRDAV
ncbi:RidA family protein [Acrocarpospora macrocephala]|uniref:Bifunctional translation initiation inhibitor n=1 Tax=Acrocarpospora macrocephala TaxID=150177 RepID=A0A5M3WQC9_9ACTN|nr:RidA family protein [Acrocarpospora macrocephala]GES11567.1 bifunctional translation initiation inhibitor [Acrocarpospora macrocephala]